MRFRGTDIAKLLVRSTFATRACRKVSGVGIYVAIVSALYSIIREYLMPCTTSDHAIAHLCWTLGLDTDVVHQLAETLADPPASKSAHVSDLLLHSMSAHYECTHFEMAGSELFGSAAVGTRPGHPLADLVFHFALAVIMRKVGAALEAEICAADLHVQCQWCLFFDTQYVDPMRGAPIGFVDDLLFNVEVDNRDICDGGFQVLVDKVCRTVQLVAHIFGNHALRLNDRVGEIYDYGPLHRQNQGVPCVCKENGACRDQGSWLPAGCRRLLAQRLPAVGLPGSIAIQAWRNTRDLFYPDQRVHCY